ncbi:hypothetical protein [Streptomyces sp. NPDC093591]|uniref:hypothetical protein n=1 Tax=Streptomyces sp. NPDC093591 TaxID=3366044 RepID=UPI0037FDFF9C
MPATWSKIHTGIICLLLILFVILFLTPEPQSGGAWLTFAVLFLALITAVGKGVCGVLAGALIDGRGRMSASRLQLIMWSITILSALLTAVKWNFHKGSENPVDITVPEQVWVLLGISATSLAGSVLVKSNKAGPPSPAGAAAPARANLLATNPSADQASLSDLFSGDEVSNKDYVDIGKVQVLFFTLVILLGYASSLYDTLAARPDAIKELPDLSEGILTLLGISHAGYLVEKAAPHHS